MNLPQLKKIPNNKKKKAKKIPNFKQMPEEISESFCQECINLNEALSVIIKWISSTKTAVDSLCHLNMPQICAMTFPKTLYE